MEKLKDLEKEYTHISGEKGNLKQQIELLLQISETAEAEDKEKCILYGEKAEEKAQELGEYQFLKKVYKYLGELHYRQGNLDRAQEYNERLLEFAVDEEDIETIILGKYNIGLIFWKRNDYEKSEKYFLKSLELAEQHGGKKIIARSSTGMGLLSWKQGRYESALEYYQKSLKLSGELSDKKEEAQLHNYIGVIYKNQGNLIAALTHYQESLSTFTELNDSISMSKLLNNIGNLYLMQGSNEKAIDNYLQSLKVSEELGDDHTRSSILNNIGLIYFNMEDYEKSLPYHQQALEIREHMSDKSAVAHSLKNLGLAYQKTDQAENSMDCKMRAVDIEIEIDDKSGLATTYSLIGLSYMDDGDLEQARANYNQSLKLYEELGDKPGTAANLINLGSIHLQLEEYEEAEKTILRGLNLAEETGVESLIKDGYNILSELFEETGDYQKAHDYYKKFTEIRYHLENLESKQHIENIQAKYEFDKREKEAEIYRLKNIELAKANAELTLLKENLEQQVDEGIEELRKKDSLMAAQSRQAEMGKMIGFIAHQWKQPLNSIGLIAQNLADAYDFGELDEEVLEKGTSNIFELVNYMAKTIDDFRNFFRPDTTKTIFDPGKVIETTLKLISRSFDADDIKVNLELAEGCSVEGFPNELSQVIINLLNNAREALEEDNDLLDKQVWVSLHKQDKKVVIKIKDNGKGIPESVLPRIFEPYFTTKLENKGTGLGLYMSKTIINEKMKGDISINCDTGTVFKIELQEKTTKGSE